MARRRLRSSWSSCLSSPNLVRNNQIRSTHGTDAQLPARILLRQGKRSVAHANLQKVYPNDTREQVDARVSALEELVQESINITNTTTFTQRLSSVFSVPANRRALSGLFLGVLRTSSDGLVSHRMRLAGIPATLRFQHFDVLVCASMLMPTYQRSTSTSPSSATLFKSIGFNKPTAVGLIISGTNFIFTLFALKCEYFGKAPDGSNGPTVRYRHNWEEENHDLL